MPVYANLVTSLLLSHLYNSLNCMPVLLFGIFSKFPIRELHVIGKELELPMSLNLNLARHSFATRLMIDGTPTSYISDALGHSSSAVTAHYMKTLPDAQYKKISESLLTFG